MRILIGFLLIVTSPLILVFVGEQNRAQDFSNLEQVSSETAIEGEVIIEGQTSIVPSSSLTCPNSEKACIFVSTVREVYKRSETIVCDEIPEDIVVLEQVEDRCDGSTGICEPCYLTESYAWTQQKEGTLDAYAEFTVGAYLVKPSAETSFLQTQESEYQEFDEVEEGDERFTYEYVPLNETLLVAGAAKDGMIASRSESGTFLVSNEEYNATLLILDTQDKTAKNGVRFLSLFVMMLGFIVFTSQVSGPVLGLFKIIPGLGQFMEKSSKMAITVVAAVIGAIVWLAMFFPLSYLSL